VPKVDLATAPTIAVQVYHAIQQGWVAGCHDCSEGGLAVALAEMGFAGGLGLDVNIKNLPVSKDCTHAVSQLFSESNARYVIEVRADKATEFIAFMRDVPCGGIGQVTQEATLRICDGQGNAVIDAPLATLKKAWQTPLRW
jgi:phosphoribosylformylglycinamidine synthase